MSRALYSGFVVLLVIWFVSSQVQHTGGATPNPYPGLVTADLTERLRVADTTLSLTPGFGCVAHRIPWHIEDYGSRSYQITWTVSHDQARPWRWTHVTEDVGPQGDLQVLICPSVAGPGTSSFTVTGVLDGVTTNPPTGGTAPAATGHLSVSVHG